MIEILTLDVFQFITLIILMHVSVLVAYLLQWNDTLSILKIDAFRIEPWCCSYCMQFWTHLIPCIVLGYVWSSSFYLYGLITAGALSYSVYRSEKRRPD